jgi:peroxiredoxin
VLTAGLSAAPPPADPSRFSPPEPAPIEQADPAIVAAADGLLRQAMETFRSAPVVQTETTVHTRVGETDRSLTVSSLFGPDGSALIEAPESTLRSRDGTLTIVLQDVWDRYLQIPVGLSLADGVEAAMGDRALAGFEVMMRDGDPPESWLEVLLMRTIGKPTIVGLDRVEGADGLMIDRVLLAGRFGTGWVDLDGTRRVILGAHADMRIVPEEDLEPFELTMNLETNTRFLEALPKPLAIDTGIRTPVSHRHDLDPVLRNRLSVGQKAPALKLRQLGGGEVDLAELKGENVILCFWSSWADASKRGVQQLAELQERLAGLENVHCYAVNIMERTSDPAEREALVRFVWEKAGFDVPTLLTPDDQLRTAWGLATVPYSVVIGPDGMIRDIQVGWAGDWVKRAEAQVASSAP